MKNERFKKYIYWGITAFTVLALSIAFIFLIINWRRIKEVAGQWISILTPIIYGAVFAYLLNPIYNRTKMGMNNLLKKTISSGKTRRQISATVATFVSLLMLVCVVTGLISMLIPELYSSITGIIEAMPSSIANLEHWLEQVFADNPQVEAEVMQQYAVVTQYLQDWITNDVVPNAYNIISGLSSGIFSVVRTVMNLLIGLIVMIYLLNMKEKLMSQAKMIIYAAFPLKVANKVVEECRYVHQVFGGFIIGKLLDSLIIGIICFVLLSLMNMPYVLLVSVIIGATNVIPFFGPFIGAVPSAFLILLVSPMKCLYFIIFILLLQQVDGNIIGPKILGDSTGLSSFWVLFSILLFGGLFGFVGMIIGVPTFAVIYRLTKELTQFLLGKKKLPAESTDYDCLEAVVDDQLIYKEK